MKKLFVTAALSSALFGLNACGPTPDTVVVGLQNQNPAVREDMVKVARNANDPEVIKALITTLNDPAPGIRIEAIESLAHLGASDAVPAIVERLSDEDDLVQRAAVDALGKLADPRGASPLVTFIEQREPTGRVPLNAIWALGNIGDGAALDVLARLRNNSDPYVIYNACWALRNIKGGAASEAGASSEG